MKLKGKIKILLNNFRTGNSTFFPIINMKSSNKILLRILSLRKVEVIYVNGKKCRIKKYKSHGFIYLVESSGMFHNGENIVTIMKQYVIGLRQIIKVENEVIYFEMEKDLTDLLSSMIITDGQFKGYFQTSYDFGAHGYRLQSWIWTSSIPYFYLLKYYQNNYSSILNVILSNVLNLMKKSIYGGVFEIRWDIDSLDNTINKIIAPNDLSIIGNFILLETYKINKNPLLLDRAIQIAEWIIRESQHEDGLIKSGYSTTKEKWEDSWLYVDSGFVLTFFVNLFEITKNIDYFEFCRRFTSQYIHNFYDEEEHYFIKTFYFNDVIVNRTFFTRGQAWALEGLISWYELSLDDKILKVIKDTIYNLIKLQNKNGSWYYIANKKSSGECGKTTPILAYQFTRYLKVINADDKVVLDAVNNSLKWCSNKIVTNNRNFFGFDSFTIEGNIVGERFTSSNFTYSSAYYLLAKKYFDNNKLGDEHVV